MPRKILVRKGYTVADWYITLEDCEVLCDKCGGIGKARQYFGPPGGWDRMMTCEECGGDGKRLKCVKCGRLEHHAMLKYKDKPELEGLCYSCLKAALKID